LSQGGKQVFPCWVLALDQLDLLSAGPFLEFFFTCESGPDICEVFEVNEAVYDVARGVSAGGGFPVPGYTADEAVGHADVEIS